MPFAYEQLKGIDRQRLTDLIEPIVTAHGLDGVEAIWRKEDGGQVLYLTVERPGSSDLGAGITLDDCSGLSRDVAAALDEADAIAGAYRLEVGSPGVERQLYRVEDYQRFAGQTARVKCHELVLGQRTLRGTLDGIDSEQRVLMTTDQGPISLEFQQIESGRLVLEMAKSAKKNPVKRPAPLRK